MSWSKLSNFLTANTGCKKAGQWCVYYCKTQIKCITQYKKRTHNKKSPGQFLTGAFAYENNCLIKVVQCNFVVRIKRPVGSGPKAGKHP